MNEQDQQALFAALNEALDILSRNRRPDPAFVAAFDTLKQSRAMLEDALSGKSQSAKEVEMAA